MSMYLACCNKSVYFYQWPNGYDLNNFNLREDLTIGDISWCCNGSRLAALSNDAEVFILETPRTDRKVLNAGDLLVFPSYKLNVKNVAACAFSKVKNNLIAIASTDGEIYTYDTKSKSIVSDYPVLSYGIKNIAFSHDDNILAIGCSKGFVVSYKRKNHASSMCATYMIDTKSSLSCMNFDSENTNLLSAGCDDGIVSLWNTQTGSTIINSKKHDGAVFDIAFSVSNNIFTSIGADKKIITYCMKNGVEISKKTLDQNITSIAFVPGKMETVVGTIDGELLFLDDRYATNVLKSFSTRKSPITKISFYTPAAESDSQKNNFDEEVASNETLESSDPSVFTDAKRIAGGMDATVDTLDELNDRLYSNQNPECVCNIKLMQIKNTLLKEMNSIVTRFSQLMNQEFIKLRMEMTKSFISIEETTTKKSSQVGNFLNANDDKNGDLLVFSDKRKSSKHSTSSTRKGKSTV